MKQLLKKSDVGIDEFQDLVIFLYKNEYGYEVQHDGEESILFVNTDDPYTLFMVGQLFQNHKIHNYLKNMIS